MSMQAIKESVDFQTYLNNIRTFTDGAIHSWWLPTTTNAAKVHDLFIKVIDELVETLKQKKLRLISIGSGHGILEQWFKLKGVDVVTIDSYDPQYDTTISCSDGERRISFFEGDRFMMPRTCTPKKCQKELIAKLFEEHFPDCSETVLFCSYPPPLEKARHISHYFDLALQKGLKRAILFVDNEENSCTSLEKEPEFQPFAEQFPKKSLLFTKDHGTRNYLSHQTQDRMTFIGDDIATLSILTK